MAETRALDAWACRVMGIPVIASRFLTVQKASGRVLEKPYPDWRARLARNDGRAFVGQYRKMEPLWYEYPEVLTVPDPKVYLLNGVQVVAHPETIARMKL